MTITIDRETITRARHDVEVFARAVVGAPLWPHQVEVVRSNARIRIICSGRQAGKSRTLALLALHAAFVQSNALVLVLSAGEEAAKDLLSEIALLCGSALLAGAVVDEHSSRIVLSNGSEVRSVPASIKQVRGKSVDLLILDEAAFIEREIWRAAQFTPIARRESRIVMASTPFGRQDGFFATAYRAGLNRAEGFASFHWPSTVSPLVDETLLEIFKRSMSEREYLREVEAEWVDDAGAYFTSDEINSNVANYELIDPAHAGGQVCVGGVDWGFSDANVLVLLAVLADGDLNRERHPEYPVFFIPWVEERFKMPYSTFIERVVEVGSWSPHDPGRSRASQMGSPGFFLRSIASETNGVGQMPTEMLKRRFHEERLRSWVSGIHTDVRRKMTAFGALKMLLQQGRLVLPRHPALLGQLADLEFETLDTGNLRISVPEHRGHDDILMGLAQASSCVSLSIQRYSEAPPVSRSNGELIINGTGTCIPKRPSCWHMPRVFIGPRGDTRQEDW